LNLVADEGIDRQIVELLRAREYVVLYVAELAPGLDDDSVLAAASKSGALLLTHDLDFGELVFRQRQAASGVLLLRRGRHPAEERNRSRSPPVCGVRT